MTPEQCRLARSLARWTRSDLAAAAAAPLEVVQMFEAGSLEGWAGLELDMRMALEGRGVVFVGRAGVEARASSPERA